MTAFLDTNVLIHSMRDPQNLGVDCAKLLLALQEGRQKARLDPLVVHELTYALPRIFKQMTRKDVATALAGLVNWPGIATEKEVLTSTLQLWANTPGLGFVDALLATRAQLGGEEIYSKNVKELRSIGATVPDPLPS